MKTTQIAAQLYTIRDWLKTPADVASSLSRVREIGYRAVELASLGPIETAEVRKILAGEGLVCASVHADANEILEQPDAVADRLEELGCAVTVYPFPNGIAFAGLTEVRDFASRLNRSGRLLEKRGITLAYHNHDIEFIRIGDRPILEILYEETDPAFLQAELDTYWVQAGGGSPVDWCARLAGRLPALHMKDYGISDEREAVSREIGRGNLDWPAIIATAEASGCRWFIVEQDSHWIEGDPFASLSTSFDFIRKNLLE